MTDSIIVTGGAGFIGSNLVAGLNAEGERRILIVDRLRHGDKWRNLAGLEFEDFVDKDVFREDLRRDRIEPPAVVFHMGACSRTTETDADYLLDNNYRYSRELCEWCGRRQVRFIYASSAATYGDGAFGYSDADANTVRLRPLNMYAYSKHAFDLWALRHGWFEQITGLKFFNVYGPNEEHKGDMRSVVSKARRQIAESGTVRLFRSYRDGIADGEQTRDFLFVRDAVRVMLYLRRHPEIAGLFNCGTGRARTWNDLARAVFAALDREPRIEFVEMPPALRDKYQYATEADMTRLKAAGWREPFTTLEDGVARYVRDRR